MIYDALGNEIVMGNMYGYSTASESVRTTVIGIAEKISPSGLLTIRIVRRMRPRAEFTGQYDDKQKPIYRSWMEDITTEGIYSKPKATTSYSSDFMFPVQL